MKTNSKKGAAIDKWSDELKRRISEVQLRIKSGLLTEVELMNAQDILYKMRTQLDEKLVEAVEKREEFCKRPKPFFGLF